MTTRTLERLALVLAAAAAVLIAWTVLAPRAAGQDVTLTPDSLILHFDTAGLDSVWVMVAPDVAEGDTTARPVGYALFYAEGVTWGLQGQEPRQLQPLQDFPGFDAIARRWPGLAVVRSEIHN